VLQTFLSVAARNLHIGIIFNTTDRQQRGFWCFSDRLITAMSTISNEGY